MPLCGGTGATKGATEDIQNICDQVKAQTESFLGKNFQEFRAVGYRSQVVAGVNYFVKVKIISLFY